MGPTPAVAAVRRAVRESLRQGGPQPDGPQPLALVACSGGADSVALAAAAAFEGPRGAWRIGAATVDHRLQQGSAGRAADVVGVLLGLGLDPVEAIAVHVATGATAGGPEAAARTARYEALDAIADRVGAAVVLLGHTLDDQAETVLLGLARGSGTRSIAGMAATAGAGGRYRRPFLGLHRELTRAACADLGLPVWDDPHNGDDAFARSRVRATALPALETALGPGIAEALARTADLARDDADALDAWATNAYRESLDGDGALSIDMLATLPAAVRRRVLRMAAVEAGASPGALAANHLGAIDALITDWHGQGAINLPGGRIATRRYGRLYLGTGPITSKGNKRG